MPMATCAQAYNHLALRLSDYNLDKALEADNYILLV